MLMPFGRGCRSLRWRIGLMVTLLAGLGLGLPVPESEAHTCTPDPTVGVSGGRLLVPRGSGVADIWLPSRDTRTVAITPQLGNAAGVAVSPDGGLLAVSRFWRPPQHQVGGQDILIVGPEGGEPMATRRRSWSTRHTCSRSGFRASPRTAPGSPSRPPTTPA